MYILEEELKNYHEHYKEDLNAYGYCLMKNANNEQIFIHESNKSEIIITLKGKMVFVNYKNSLGENFYTCDWYIGSTEYGTYSFTDITTLMQDGNFIKFCNKEPAWKGDNEPNDNKPKDDKTTKDIVLSQTQERIKDICNQLASLLIYKNQKYGNSAIEPNNIFYKGDNTNSILIRLDDKLSRVKNSSQLRTNDICDIIGYLVLLLVSKDVTNEEIEKLKD